MSEVVIGTRTLDAMLAELDAAAAPAQPADGVTVEDLARQSGWSVKRVRENLKRAIEGGAWKYAGQRSIVRMDGKRCGVPIYCRVAPKRKR